MYCFSFHFSCLSVCLLRSFKHRFYTICLSECFLRCKNVPDDRFGTSENSETFPTIVLVLSEFPKHPRRLFWCFRNFRKLPDDRFGVFGNSEMFPMTVLAFSEIPKIFLWMNNL